MVALTVYDAMNLIEQEAGEALNADTEEFIIRGDLLRKIQKIFSRFGTQQEDMLLGMISYVENRYAFNYSVFVYSRYDDQLEEIQFRKLKQEAFI